MNNIVFLENLLITDFCSYLISNYTSVMFGMLDSTIKKRIKEENESCLVYNVV